MAVIAQRKFPTSDDYDMPGFVKAWLNLDPRAMVAPDPHDGGRIHYTDPWKRPNHPSFSDQSVYAGNGAPSWKEYDVNPASNTFDYWRTPESERKKYWRLEKPNGDVVSWDSPWLQGTSTERLRQTGEYGLPTMSRDGLAGLLGWR